jgi:hypothetical protein
MPRGGHNRLPDAMASMRGTERRASRGAVPAAADPGTRLKVPKPPKSVKGVVREVWLDLAAQVEEKGTYTSTTRTGFRLMVQIVARVEMAPADTAPTAYAHMQRAAAGWLERFGLTANSPGTVPPPSAGGDRFGSGSADPVEAFLFGRPMLAVVKGGKRG